MKNILITGANGFIGSHLSKSLELDKKYRVTKIDRSFGDISREDTWKKFPACETVIHLAAQIFIPDSWKNPKKFLNTNINSTLLALEYCKKNKSKLIFLSSYLYVQLKKNNIKGNQIKKMANPYILSKKVAEDVCRFYSYNFDVSTLILRPSNVYGSGQNENFLIPSILKQIKLSKKINVNNLTSQRDFIYIKDLVEAIKKTISLKSKYEIITVGNGKSYSVKDVVKIIQKIKGTNFQVKSKKKVSNKEILNIFVNIKKAKKLINWKPTWSLEKGIQDSYGAR